MCLLLRRTERSRRTPNESKVRAREGVVRVLRMIFWRLCLASFSPEFFDGFDILYPPFYRRLEFRNLLIRRPLCDVLIAEP